MGKPRFSYQTAVAMELMMVVVVMAGNFKMKLKFWKSSALSKLKHQIWVSSWHCYFNVEHIYLHVTLNIMLVAIEPVIGVNLWVVGCC